MALRVVDHYPAINAINVPKNASVKVEFNTGIVPQSVLSSTFSVNEASTYSTQPGTLGVEYDSSGNCIRAVFQPLINFTANTKYRVYLFNAPNSVVSINNENLTTAYSWEFTAGTGVLVDEFPEGIPSGDLPASGDIIVSGVTLDSGLYTILETQGLLVTETNPHHQEPNVSLDTSGVITITFNTELLTSESDMSGFVSLTTNDVLY